MSTLANHQFVLKTLVRRYELTPRESQVLDGVLRGQSNNEIASELNVALRTVKTHVERIWEKLNIHSRAELMGLLFREKR